MTVEFEKNTYVNEVDAAVNATVNGNDKPYSGDSSSEIVDGSLEVIDGAPDDQAFQTEDDIENGSTVDLLRNVELVTSDLESGQIIIPETDFESESIVIQPVEESGFAHDSIGNMDQYLNDGLDSVSYLCEDQKTEETVINEKLVFTDVGETQETQDYRMEDCCENEKPEKKEKADSDFMMEDAESVEVDVELRALNKENADVIDNNKESQIVVLDGVENTFSVDDDNDESQPANEVENPLEIGDDNKQSETVVMENIQDTSSPNDDAVKQSENEVEQPLEIINDNWESQMVVVANVEDYSSPDDNDEAQSADEVDQPFEITDDSKIYQMVVMEGVNDTSSLDDDDAKQSVNVIEQPLESIDDNGESQMLVMEKVEDCSSLDDDEEAQSADEVDHKLEIIDNNKHSHMVVMESVEDTSSQDDEDATKLANEAVQPFEMIDDATGSQIVVIDNVHDDKQTKSDVEEASVKEDFILIFPVTFVSPEINIQFGSFGLHEKDPNALPDDLNIVLEVSNKETEPTSDPTPGTNSNSVKIVCDGLQDNVSAEKVIQEELNGIADVVPVSSLEVLDEFIDAQIEDTNSKVNKVDDVIEHETLCFKDEKQFIPEIKQLQSYGDQLKPEVAALSIRKTYEEDNGKGKEVLPQSQATTDEKESISVVTTIEQGKKTVSSTENEHTGYQTVKKAAGKFNHSTKTKEPVKFVIRDSRFACLNDIMEDEDNEKNVVEFNKKANEVRKKETECKLKEKIRLEEKKKANEAMEKARDKRLRKKERKRTHGENSNNTKDENIKKANQKPQGPSSVASTTERKRRCYQCAKMGMAAALITITFFLSNIIYVG